MTDGHPARDTRPPRPLRPVRDLAGIRVRDASGVPVGALWGALADGETGLLRYLDIALESMPRHVLVPIGHARLRETLRAATAPPAAHDDAVVDDRHTDDTHEVRLRAALLEELIAIPAFQPEQRVDETYEHALLRAHGAIFHGERYYAHPAFDHRGLYAGRHPIARDEGVRADAGLQPLRQLNGYRIAREEPDVRGWPVIGADAPLGITADLIVDVDAEDVRYLVLERDGRRVLLPIGFLDVDVDTERIIAPSLYADDVAHLPVYRGGSVERAFEQQARDAIEEQFSGPRLYDLPDYRT